MHPPPNPWFALKDPRFHWAKGSQLPTTGGFHQQKRVLHEEFLGKIYQWVCLNVRYHPKNQWFSGLSPFYHLVSLDDALRVYPIFTLNHHLELVNFIPLYWDLLYIFDHICKYIPLESLEPNSSPIYEHQSSPGPTPGATKWQVSSGNHIAGHHTTQATGELPEPDGARTSTFHAGSVEASRDGNHTQTHKYVYTYDLSSYLSNLI